MRFQIRNLSGHIFGRLTVERLLSCKGKALWFCKCSCGGTKAVLSSYLVSGRTKSCGCMKGDPGRAKRTHGYSKSNFYRVWRAMRSRCENPKAIAYSRYGGRGIKVCKRWHRFENFLTDMGHPIAGQQLERINNNLGYYKKNCRWASPREQSNNRRNSIVIDTPEGKMTLSYFAEKQGRSYEVLRRKYQAGFRYPEILDGRRLR